MKEMQNWEGKLYMKIRGWAFRFTGLELEEQVLIDYKRVKDRQTEYLESGHPPEEAGEKAREDIAAQDAEELETLRTIYQFDD